MKRVRFGFGKNFDASDFEFKRDDALDYEMKVSLRIRFEMKFFSCQILTYKLYNLPDLEFKILQYVTFWIYFLKPVRFCIEKKQHVRFWYGYISTSSFSETIALKSHVLSFQSMKTTFFCSFRAFLEQMFWEESFTPCHILNWKENNASNFETKEQRNRIWLDHFTRCQFLYWKNVNTSDFEIEFHWHVSIWKKKNKRRWIWKKGVRFCVKTLQRVRFGNEGNFIASDLVLKILKRVRFGIGNIFDASDFKFKKDNALDYEMKVSLRIRFEMKIFFSGQILTYKLYNLPDLEFKILQYVTFWIYLLKPVRFCIEKKQHVRFWYGYIPTSSFSETIALKSHVLSFQSMKTTFFCSFRAFLEQMFWEENFTTCQILNWKENNASNFETKRTTQQVLTLSFYKVPVSVSKKCQHIKFWNWVSLTCQYLKEKE